MGDLMLPRRSPVVCVRTILQLWGNRRLPFFLEQTTLANVETYTAILTAQILPTAAIHTIEVTTTLEPEGMDAAQRECGRSALNLHDVRVARAFKCTQSVVESGGRRPPRFGNARTARHTRRAGSSRFRAAVEI